MEREEALRALLKSREQMMYDKDGNMRQYGDLSDDEKEFYDAVAVASVLFYEKDGIEQIVVAKHAGDNGHYLFSVPKGKKVEKDEIIVVRNKRGETTATCVCDSFEIQENVLKALAVRYGATLPLAPVIGVMQPRWW